MELQRAKGVRDFSPEEKILREKIVSILKTNFERYGFSPLETPIIERYETLSAKYAGGDEILKETFSFYDQGERKLGLRYDLTVPLCRYISMNPRTKLPFKRYQISRVFRDGPVKLGRYREFWQCDIDIVGTKSVLAEAQLLEIAKKSFKDLGLEVDIRINNRKILNGILKELGAEDYESVILSIDKLEKIGEDGVRKELQQKGFNKTEELFGYLNKRDINELDIDNEEGREGIKEIKELLSYVDVNFDITLARGLNYYTGPVYEIFLKDQSKLKSAVAAGGRYDSMIGNFLDSESEYPAAGLSFGLEALSDIMEPKEKTVTNIYIIPINTMKESSKIANQLRERGINVDMDIMNRGISKNLKYADSYSIPFVLIIGEEELKKDKLKVKDMKSGEEKEMNLDEIVHYVRTSTSSSI